MRRRDLILGFAGAAALTACSRDQDTAEAPADAPGVGEGLGFPDPADVIRPLYDRYLTPGATFPSFENQAPWSADLRAQLQAMTARSEARNEPILDFDPIIGAQDYQITGVTVTTEAAVQNSHAAVRARFTNLGQPKEIVFYTVWEGGAWRVNNITGDDNGVAWDLRQIAQQSEAQPATP
jgi:hypothetical protein